MNYQMDKIYSHNTHLLLELTIYNDFLGFNDLIRLSRINKYFNSSTKKYIEKYYEFLNKCINIPIKNSYASLYIIDNNEYKYDREYWYKLFNKKLNSQELAIYYSYFIKNYYYSCRKMLYLDQWICSIYQDGFIKLLANKNDGSVLIDKNDVILKCIIDYKYDNFNINEPNIQIKKIYCNVKVKYMQDFISESNLNNISKVDEILLLELLKNFDYNEYCNC